MKVGKPAQLAVKWENGTWTTYQVSKYRTFKALITWFTIHPRFRMAILYEWNKSTKQRGNELLYFDKSKTIYK